MDSITFDEFDEHSHKLKLKCSLISEPCEAGRYMVAEQCVDCLAGDYSAFNATECTKCAAGRTSSAGAVSCVDIPGET